MSAEAIVGQHEQELTQMTRRAVIARCAATAGIPEQIEALAREYRESGGEQGAPIEAITE